MSEHGFAEFLAESIRGKRAPRQVAKFLVDQFGERVAERIAAELLAELGYGRFRHWRIFVGYFMRTRALHQPPLVKTQRDALRLHPAYGEFLPRTQEAITQAGLLLREARQAVRDEEAAKKARAPAEALARKIEEHWRQLGVSVKTEIVVAEPSNDPSSVYYGVRSNVAEVVAATFTAPSRNVTPISSRYQAVPWLDNRWTGTLPLAA